MPCSVGDNFDIRTLFEDITKLIKFAEEGHDY